MGNTNTSKIQGTKKKSINKKPNKLTLSSSSSTLETKKISDKKPETFTFSMDIHVRNEFIVHGYIRSNFSNQVTVELKTLCLNFFGGLSEWDPNLHGDHLEIVDNGNCVKMINYAWATAYLTDSFSSGIHHWQFKIENGPASGHYFLFGIWKTNSGKPILNRYFTDIHNNGYAFDAPYGRLTTPSIPGGGGPSYAKACKVNDIIDMYVDFNILRLTFAINDEYYGDGQTIDKTEYKAAITMHATNNKIRLISYDNIKTDKIISEDLRHSKSKKKKTNIIP